MKVLNIQPTQTKTYNNVLESKHNSRYVSQTDVPTFKGSGKGFMIGLGGSLLTGLVTVCGTAIAGALTLPASVAGAVILGLAVAGGFAGDKIEDKIAENDDENKNNKLDAQA